MFKNFYPNFFLISFFLSVVVVVAVVVVSCRQFVKGNLQMRKNICAIRTLPAFMPERKKMTSSLGTISSSGTKHLNSRAVSIWGDSFSRGIILSLYHFSPSTFTIYFHFILKFCFLFLNVASKSFHGYSKWTL